MAVFVLDSSGKPLMPCSEKRARLLLGRGQARVHRLVPMVIRIIDRTQAASVLQSLRLSGSFNIQTIQGWYRALVTGTAKWSKEPMVTVIQWWQKRTRQGHHQKQERLRVPRSTSPA